MATKCIINSATKIVENVIVIEDGVEWSAPHGFEIAPNNTGNIGDTWDGEKFVSPIVPEESVDVNAASGSAPDVIA